MEPIKISVDVKIDFSESVKNFVSELFSGVKASTSATPSAPAKPVSTPAALTKPASAPQASAAPAKPASAPQASAAPATSAISIETVRQALAAKVNSHREEIKAKLNELGSPSVTKLNPEKYGEMLAFLNSLS